MKPNELRNIIKSSSMFFQLSISAICPIILLMAFGMWLDGKYGNGGFWFTAAGIICGVYSAYRGCYYLIKDVWIDKEEKDVGSDSKQN